MELEKAKQNTIPKTPFAFFRYVSAPHKKWVFLSILFVVIAATGGSFISYLFKLIVDAVEAGNLKDAMWWGLMFPVATFAVQFFYRLSGYAGLYWANGSTKTATDTLSAYLLEHSHTYFINRFAGSITSKIKNVTNAVDNIIPDFLWAHLSTIVSFIATFSLLLTVDINTAIIFLILLVTLFLVNQSFAPKKAILAKENAEAGSVLQGRSSDIFSNASTIRQYVQNNYEVQELQKLTTKKYLAGIANWFYTEKLLFLNSCIVFFFAFIMFWLLVYKWGQGAVTVGDFVLVLSLVSNITGSLLFIGRAFNSAARMVGEMREGLDDILVPYEITDSLKSENLQVEKGSIDWQDVTFKFGKNKVFSNFNLMIEGNQRIGLVGTSGAGKSTFVSLLLRQHDINDGQILIDGQNIAQVAQNSLREAIAVVPQEPALFHRTIRENIAYSRPEATLEEIIAVSKQAHVHEFIEKLPDGYDTLVGERGVKLSGGQKQRVAIARAMLKNAPILILDEATSALDSESEVAIQQALHSLMEGKTVIAIAHRLSTLREMDRILVLEDGEIIEEGTHKTLVEKKGRYAKLWEHQAGGFIPE